MVLPGTLFEEFGFNYFGPVDGHDLDALVHDAANLRELQGPQFLHVDHPQGPRLRAGRGRPDPLPRRRQVRPDRGIMQARGASPRTRRCSATGSATWRRATGGWSASRRRCARARGWSLSQEFPDRYFDVGIAEQHAVTFAAGLACEGMKPVVAIYSTFLQRGYDQLIHDVALQNLPVVFAIDRAGLVGADGATHTGAFDLVVPALPAQHGGDGARRRERVPADAVHRVHARRPRRVRYPRGTGAGVAIEPGADARSRWAGPSSAARRSGAPTLAILAFGTSCRTRAGGGRGAGRDRREHALGQAAGRRAAGRARPHPRRVRHRRGERR